MLKKLSILFMIMFALGLMQGSALAVSYCQDVLEEGNPGGRTTGLKTCDAVNPQTISTGDQFSIDIWANGFSEPIIGASLYLTYNPAQVAIVNVVAYEGPGAWDEAMTNYYGDFKQI